MARWLLKTDSEDYTIFDLKRDEHTVWDGITNNWALKNIRQMKTGDICLIYHTGSEKCITGLAEAVSDPYPNTDEKKTKIFVIKISFRKHLSRNIYLSEVKKDAVFAEFPLVKFSRLSVIPVEDKFWDALVSLNQELNEF